MELKKLDKYKLQFKNLTGKIESLASLLKELENTGKNAYAITPYVISKKLQIDETDAFFLLSIAEKENILHKKYQVWSNNDTFLGDYENAHNIPETIIDLETGEQVDRDHFYVDIVFELENE